MKLHPPFVITSRLLPGLHIRDNGQLSEISIEPVGETSSGIMRFRYYIDTPEFNHEDSDLKSGWARCPIQEAMQSLLGFLTASVESYRYNHCEYSDDPDSNCSLFPQNVVEWAYQNDMALRSLELELSETEDLIEA